MTSSNSISQKEYLKKYLSGDVKKKKKKKIKPIGANIKRSVIVDDDIDLKSMRPLEDDEVELYQMDEDAPQIAGIVDERPPEVKAQEYYSSKRWKVFGGEDGVNIVDSMNTNSNIGKVSEALDNSNDTDSYSGETKLNQKNRFDGKDISSVLKKGSLEKKKTAFNDPRKDDKRNISSSSDRICLKTSQNDSDESPQRVAKSKPSHYEDDSDASPPRKHRRKSSSNSDASPPRRRYDRDSNDSDQSPPRRESRRKSPKHSSRYEEQGRGRGKSKNHHNSPLRPDKTIKHKSKDDSDSSPPRKHSKSYKNDRADSDATSPRRTDKYSDKNLNRRRKRSLSDSDNTPPRKDRRKSPKPQSSKKRLSRSRTPQKRSIISKSYRKKSPRSSGIGTNKTTDSKRCSSDSVNSPPRRRSEESDSDMSPPRNNSRVNDRPLKKVLYKPNDDSSSDQEHKSKSNKMKTTLDGKQAGLQDAKQLKKELSDLRMKEDAMFSKMDASVSGASAAPVRRDRKTGQIRDLEKEKEAQKEKDAKQSAVNEKYYKWGKGIKQTEDAVVRAAEVMKEMNKPLARYVDDKDLDEFLKAQDREGDPMLEYIKRKQTESTPLQEEKPIYKGSWNPNRFNIRPGYRWDGVVRSNGYEQEWFKTKNAKKARDEEAYKWSTSDM